jgi:succinate dehydrogenase / fumarate reductase, flavoprotein subunit
VFLDISHREKSYILEKLPRMYRQFLEAQMLDISREPMEVAPTAHYSMGGVVVEPETHATDVEGLYAAGEVTTGLHGANRLGGNSLSETIVFGRRAGEAAATFSMSCDVQLRSRQKIAEADEDLSSLIREGEEFARPLQRALRNTMWECCGVVRDKANLGEGLDRLRKIQAVAGDVDVRPTSEGYADLAHALDLRASLLSAEASLLGAIERRETRGAHNRTDFPEIDPRLKKNFVVTRDERGTLAISGKAVDEVPGDLEEWARDDGEVDIAGRLLE